MRIVIILYLLTAVLLPAEDWTVAGKTYKNVTVMAVHTDTVSIAYDGGVGRVNLCDLPPDLQKKFNYDPVAAKQAMAAEKQREAQSDALAAKVAADEKAKEEQEAAAQPDAPTAHGPAKSSLSPAQRQQIQAQIDSLNADISMKRGHENKLINRNTLGTDGARVTTGTYAQDIAVERAQVQQLQAQLNQP